MNAVRRALRRLRRDARGGVAIPFVLWLPVLTAMMMAVTDLSLLLAGSAGMDHAARDTARAVARGMISAEAAEAHLRALLPVGDRNAYAVQVLGGAEVRVEVSVAPGALAPFGLFDRMLTEGFAVSVSTRNET